MARVPAVARRAEVEHLDPAVVPEQVVQLEVAVQQPVFLPRQAVEPLQVRMEDVRNGTLVRGKRLQRGPHLAPPVGQGGADRERLRRPMQARQRASPRADHRLVQLVALVMPATERSERDGVVVIDVLDERIVRRRRQRPRHRQPGPLGVQHEVKLRPDRIRTALGIGGEPEVERPAAPLEPEHVVGAAPHVHRIAAVPASRGGDSHMRHDAGLHVADHATHRPDVHHRGPRPRPSSVGRVRRV
jgi:hypothetical protein